MEEGPSIILFGTAEGSFAISFAIEDSPFRSGFFFWKGFLCIGVILHYKWHLLLGRGPLHRRLL